MYTVNPRVTTKLIGQRSISKWGNKGDKMLNKKKNLDQTNEIKWNFKNILSP